MKIIFLDFDGVLNSHSWWDSLSEAEKTDVMGLDPVAVARLHHLVCATSARVVVSSTWRHGRSRTRLQTILADAGFGGQVLGTTPEWLRKSDGGIYCAEERGQEIQAWLDAAPRYGHDVESFVILDDNSDMAHLMDRLVQTTTKDGLQDEHVERAIEMLTEPPPLIVLPSGGMMSP
jgi:HAD domain in Swiss Army Knife RNA repair proteins